MRTSSLTTFSLRATAVAATLLASGLAQAQFSTDGYFRSGTGAGVKGAPTTCFKLGKDGLDYRLGNECDTYAEINLKNTVKVGGMQFSGNAMLNYWSQAQETAAPGSLSQLYIEATGMDFAPSLNFWVGKRYYGRSDVHITDTKYTKLDGTGGGVDSIDVGAGKLGFAYFHRDAGFAGWGAASRFNAEFSTSKVNEGGWLRVLLGVVQSEETLDKDGKALDAHNGSSLTVQHYQHNLFGLGGGNTVWLQTANGAAGLDGGFTNAYNGSGNDWLQDENGTWVEDHGKTKRVRLADSFTWQVGNFGGQVVAHLQKEDNTQYTTTATSLGGRVSYAFTNNFKLVGEAGQSRIKVPGADTQSLSKYTIAPTITTGKGFFDRPELRLYYTHASWNDAAAAANSSLPAGKTSANRFGVQAEVWW